MKKYISLLLATVLLCTVCSMAAFAQTNEKISTSLQEKLHNLADDEKIEVCVVTNADELILSMFGDIYIPENAEKYRQYINKLIEEEMRRDGTWSDTDHYGVLHSKYWDHFSGELHASNNKAVLDKLGLSNEDILYHESDNTMMRLMLNKAQIYEASDWEEITYLALSYDEIEEFIYHNPDETQALLEEATQSETSAIGPEPPIDWDEPSTDEILEAAREYYNDHSITSEQIHKVYLKRLSNADFLIGLQIDGYEYPDTVKAYSLNGYVIRFSHPEPMIIRTVGLKLMTLPKANLDDVTMKKIEATGLVDMSKEYIAGDSDMDKTVSIIDATVTQKYLASLLSKWELHLPAADYDGDGVVSVLDATHIQKHLAGME